MRRVLFLVRGLVALAAFTTPILAQLSDRPKISRDADPNNWEAYYNAGVDQLQHDARAADAYFAWASHLRPDRAEPLFGRWIAYWAQHVDDFVDYLRDDERVLRDPQVKRVDSLHDAAFRRNPFVHQGLVMFVFDRMPGKWRDDQMTLAWLSLSQADLPRALERFGRIVQQDPKKYGYLRFVRASAFVNTKAYDSAAAELTALLAQLRAQDEKRLSNGYESKEMLEFAMGLLHLQARRLGPSREAFGRAVAENAAFAPAHAMLGKLAVSARDTTTALAEYALAVEIDPGDVESRIGFGNALLLAKRSKDAAAQFERATTLEPLYAEAFWGLATALEANGDAAGAATRYGQFLDRASLWDPRRPEAERKRKL